MNINTIIVAVLVALVGFSSTPLWAKHHHRKHKHERQARELGKKMDKAEAKAKDKVDEAKEKGQELHDKAKEKAHEGVDKL